MTSAFLKMPEQKTPDPFIFAQKIKLPVQESSTEQSLHMLAALEESGRHAFAVVGTSGNKQQQLQFLHEQQGISSTGLQQCQFFPSWPESMYSALLQRTLRTQLAKKPKTFFFTCNPHMIVLLLQAGRELGLKPRIIHELHEPVAHNDDQEPENIQEEMLCFDPKMAEQLAAIILPNQIFLQKLHMHCSSLPASRTEPVGFRPEDFPLVDSPRRLQEEHTKSVRLVCLSSLHSGKGIDNLIKALHFLPEHFTLTIIGGKPAQQLAQYRELVADLGGRVLLTGELSLEQQRISLANGHIAVFPQNAGDAFFSCPSLYQAMSMGFPVLLTPLPLFKGILLQGEQVHTTPDISPEGIAQGIKELAADPDRAMCIREHNLKKAPYYSWQQRAQRILHFMESL